MKGLIFYSYGGGHKQVKILTQGASYWTKIQWIKTFKTERLLFYFCRNAHYVDGVPITP